MVKRSRAQSQVAPSRRSCFRIVPPDSSRQAQTFSMKASRPIVSVLPFFGGMPRSSAIPCSASIRSTTIWVAMPAWSVPGCHSTLRPCIRWKRIRMSWIVLLKAWPRCRLPVTFGGGIMMA